MTHWSHALDTAEFRAFAAACAAAVRGDLAPPLAPDVDPALLGALATRHRIAAPVLDRLARAARGPAPSIAADLDARARRQRLSALQRTQRLILLSRTLDTAGVRHLVVKGPALALQLYGDVAARDSKDLDLLVDPARFDVATRAIVALGYALQDDHGALDGVVAHVPKHRTFRHDFVEVEMHTRLLDMDDFIALPFEQVWARRAAVSLGGSGGGGEVQALSPVDTLLYLIAHGTEHCWFRLKWLQDIARISVVYNREIPNEAMRIARAGGYDRVVSAAWLLVEAVFGIATPEGAGQGRAHRSADRATRRLVDLSLAALAAPAELASEPTLGWLVRRSHVQFAFRRAWRDRLALLRHLFTSPRSFDAGQPRLWWVYLRRPFRLLATHYARGRRRSR